MTGFLLFQVNLVADNYTFDYMNTNLNVTRLTFNRTYIGSTLNTKLVTKKINATNLAK